MSEKIKVGQRYFEKKKCFICNEEYLSRTDSNSKFCSKKCAGISFEKHIKTNCLTCGKSFEIKKKTQKYCSHKCAYESQKKDKTRKCLLCDNEFRFRNKGQIYCSKQCANQARKEFANFKCEWCGKQLKTIPSVAKHKKYCSVECYNQSKTGIERIKRNNGISNQNGYIFIHQSPNKYKQEHRIVMENYLGRELNSDEIVHHIDRDKHNNSIENLVVVTRSEHINIHREDLQRTMRKEYEQ